MSPASLILPGPSAGSFAIPEKNWNFEYWVTCPKTLTLAH